MTEEQSIQNNNLPDPESVKQDDDDLDKQLDWLIQQDDQQESNLKRSKGQEDITEDKIDALLEEEEEDEKGQQEVRKTKDLSDDESGRDDDDDYMITDDQRNAMLELEKMKQEMDYPADDPPDYDVTERVKQLNEELAQIPTPNEDEREHQVRFKDNVVDLEVPPSDYSDLEDEGEEQKKADDDVDSASQGVSNMSVNDSQSTDKKVLVEKSGKFELVSSASVEAEDDGFGVSPEAKTDIEEDKPIETSTEQQLVPTPPSKPRPATANIPRRALGPPPPARAQSAHGGSRGNHEEHSYADHYRSPYALTEEQKEMKRRREELIQKRRKEMADQKKNEDAEKKQECESAFMFWLQRKKEEASARRRDEKNNPQEDKPERDSESAFSDWLREKNARKKNEEEMEKKKNEEFEQMYIVRDKKECDKAFRQWLRKKNSEAKQATQAAKQCARINRLQARRSRKSQALARAIRQSQAFRYVDYYGCGEA